MKETTMTTAEAFKTGICVGVIIGMLIISAAATYGRLAGE